MLTYIQHCVNLSLWFQMASFYRLLRVKSSILQTMQKGLEIIIHVQCFYVYWKKMEYVGKIIAVILEIVKATCINCKLNILRQRAFCLNQRNEAGQHLDNCTVVFVFLIFHLFVYKISPVWTPHSLG